MPSLLDSALGWMQDPNRTQQLQGVGRAIQQGLLNIEQSDKRYQDLYSKAFADPKNPFKVTDKQALSQLAEMTQGGLLGMAEVGMFVGAGSKAFDKAMAFTASKMEKKGATPQEIWKETGTVRGPDGLWRQEISDKEAKFVTAPEMLDKAALLKQNIAENKQKIKESKEYPDLFPKELTAAQKVLREENKANKELVDTYTGNQAWTGAPAKLAVEHPELYKAYPDLENINVRQGTTNPNFLGSFEPKKGLLEVTSEGLKKDPRSTALHEMQHAIQEQEGFGVGGNINTMERLMSDAKYKTWMLKESDEYKVANKELTNIWDDYFQKKLSFDDAQAAEEQLLKKYPIINEYRDALSTVNHLGDDPREAYARLMGEAEARLTQTRKDLTPEERRKYFPFELQDKNVNPYGLDFPLNTLIHLDQTGKLVEKGLLGEAVGDYRGSHKAPSPDFGAPLHDLTGGGQMYPADVYSAKATQYYGTGYPKADKEAFDLAKQVRGNPDAEVTMYRAVPKDENITGINAGDWVTLSKDYAKTHGESALKGDYKIISQKVKAKDLWTNADSIHEFGYHPQDVASQQEDKLLRSLLE